MMDGNSLYEGPQQQPETEARNRTRRLLLSIAACGLLSMSEYVLWEQYPIAAEYSLFCRMAAVGVLCTIPGIEQRSVRVVLTGLMGGACARLVVELVCILFMWSTRGGYNSFVLDHMPPHTVCSHGGFLPNPWPLVVNYCIWMLAVAFVWGELWEIKGRVQFLCLSVAPAFVLSMLLAIITPWDRPHDVDPFATYPRPADPVLVRVVLFSTVPLCIMWLRVLIHLTLDKQKARLASAGE